MQFDRGQDNSVSEAAIELGGAPVQGPGIVKNTALRAPERQNRVPSRQLMANQLAEWLEDAKKRCQLNQAKLGTRVRIGQPKIGAWARKEAASVGFPSQREAIAMGNAFGGGVRLIQILSPLWKKRTPPNPLRIAHTATRGIYCSGAV